VSRWEGWIAFLVWDTGIGIPAEQQHLIFQKFQQLENPLTRRFEGRGLGLVLTQRLARLHGGDITFVSKEGQGSQFTLLLPPSPPQPTTIGTLPAMAPQPHATEPGVPGNRLVLIVEAGPQLIEDLAEQLTGLGYRVAIARSGTEALEKARRLQPCTIFLNPLLPLLSGWDVLTLLKSDAETQHIPVVVTATSAEKAQADQNRADGFLSLPVKHRALQQSLARLNTQFSPTQQEHRPLSRLTILRLSPGPERVAETGVLNAFSPQQSALDLDLSSLLHLHHYRIVEADDLDQAELLARVWKPDVVLLDGAGLTKPYPYLQQLGQCAFLASLPLVTLNQATTQAANQIGLSVFPCLAPLGTTPTVEQPEIAVLLQVIQVAAGFAWKPCILVVEAATIPSDAMEEEIMPPGLTSQEISRRQVQPADGLGPQDAPSPGITQKGAEWLQAFIQYIQKAGFRGLSARSWTEVLQQIQHQSVDLLLIRLGGTKPDLAVVKALVAIQQVEVKPPILVLDHRWQWDEVPATSIQGKVDPLEPLLQAIASQILPASLSMKELLDQIHQALAATR
jgi:CheY-like chemotaxis protein